MRSSLSPARLLAFPFDGVRGILSGQFCITRTFSLAFALNSISFAIASEMSKPNRAPSYAM
jgi:hypothetical protein